MSEQAFIESIEQGYACKGDFINLGVAMLADVAHAKAKVNIPLSTLNRHGLIAGATGTGKTKTIQLMAEQLSLQGIPVLLMDIKGDLSGLGQSGTTNEKINERQALIGESFVPQAFPIELLSLSALPGAKLRATVADFGPLLFAKMLGVNENQAGIVSVVFKYCADHKYLLLNLADFRSCLNYLCFDARDEISRDYGAISKPSVSAINRRLLELEQQGGDQFFGEPAFKVAELLKLNGNNQGIISILQLSDIQNQPKLFSSFMLCLLAKIYATLPEVGDLPKPKLVIFIDEAHLIFDKSSPALLAELETTIRLIRSKGVGIIFCSQAPSDIPEAILGQLGMKIQHALRAFTAKDRKKIKLAAENYPISDYYQVADLLTKLGVGQAAITVLNEKMMPTPLAATLLQAPRSSMAPLSKNEIKAINDRSVLVERYRQAVDRESVAEILQEKIAKTKAQTTKKPAKAKKENSTLEKVSKNTLVRQLCRTAVREVSRSVLKLLKLRR